MRVDAIETRVTDMRSDVHLLERSVSRARAKSAQQLKKAENQMRAAKRIHDMNKA